MQAEVLRQTMSSMAEDAIPETIDLWPRIAGQLAGEPSRSRLGLWQRMPRVRVLQAAALAMALAGIVLVQTLMPGQLTAAQAADIARGDPQVAALLRGDITIATVTSTVNGVATVVVEDSQGQQVTVAVDLRSRVATVVYHGPKLSDALTTKALEVVRTDPRTSALLDQGATIGRIMPIQVSFQGVDPATGEPTQGSETWAQVPLELDGKEWSAYVNLPTGRIDQLVDPQGQQVQLP
jgi:hypothetical protein